MLATSFVFFLRLSTKISTFGKWLSSMNFFPLHTSTIPVISWFHMLSFFLNFFFFSFSDIIFFNATFTAGSFYPPHFPPIICISGLFFSAAIYVAAWPIALHHACTGAVLALMLSLHWYRACTGWYARTRVNLRDTCKIKHTLHVRNAW